MKFTCITPVTDRESVRHDVTTAVREPRGRHAVVAQLQRGTSAIDMRQ